MDLANLISEPVGHTWAHLLRVVMMRNLSFHKALVPYALQPPFEPTGTSLMDRLGSHVPGLPGGEIRGQRQLDHGVLGAKPWVWRHGEHHGGLDMQDLARMGP